MSFNLEKSDIETWVNSVIFDLSGENEIITKNLSNYFFVDIFDSKINLDAFKYLNEFIIKYSQFYSLVITLKKAITKSSLFFFFFLLASFIYNYQNLVNNPIFLVPEFIVLSILLFIILGYVFFNVNFKKLFFKELIISKYVATLTQAENTVSIGNASKPELVKKAKKDITGVFKICVKEFDKNNIDFKHFLNGFRDLTEEKIEKSVENTLKNIQDRGLLSIFFSKFSSISLSITGLGLSLFMFYLKNPDFEKNYIIILACIALITPFVIQILYFSYSLLRYKLKKVRIRRPTKQVYKQIFTNK